MGLANRQRIEGCDDVGSSHERHGRLQARDVDSIAAITGRHGMRLYAGERNTRALTSLRQPIAPSQRQGFAALRLRLPFYEHQIVKGLH